MSARDVIANIFGNKEVLGHRENEPCALCFDTADAILSALDAAGFAVLGTGAIHRALQDAFQAGVGAGLGREGLVVEKKHKHCDAALAAMLKASEGEAT